MSIEQLSKNNGAKKTMFFIDLPFEIMDVAGGIVENDKNQDANKREEFKAHLDGSSILIVPFDSILLMEKPITNDKEKLDDYVSRRLSINNIEDCRIFLTPGTYTDGNLKLRISDSLLQMYDANDSLIQGFIFRCDSVRKVEE